MSTARLLLAPLVLVASLGAVAGTKALTGLASVPSLALTAVLVAALTAVLWRLERGGAFRPHREVLVPLLAAAAALAALMVWMLFDPRMGGMANLTSQPDAGSHIHYYRTFNETIGGEVPYNGLLAFHVAAYWIGRPSSMSAFEAFRATFYTIVVLVPLSWAALAAAVLPRRAAPMGGLGLALLGAWVAWGVLVPLLHGMQISGSYPALYALVPLLLGWGLYTVCRSPLARLLTGLVAIGLMRYSYALNLGDLVLAFALLAASEAVLLRGLGDRLAAGAVAAGLVAGGGLVYLRLWPLRTIGGPQPPGVDVEAVMLGQLAGALALAILPALLRLHPAAARAIRFAAAFGAVTGIAQLLYLRQGLPSEYYFHKYHFAGPFVVGAGLVLALLASLAALPRPRAGAAFAVTAIAMVVAAGCVTRGLAFYRESVAERWSSEPPYRSMGPLLNLQASRFIDRTLREEGRRFGGFFSITLPRTFFMNMLFEGPGIPWQSWWHDPDFTPNGEPLPEPGSCFFWDEPASRFYAAGVPHAAVIDRLAALPQTRCHWYRPVYEPQGTVSSLCALCLDAAPGSR